MSLVYSWKEIDRGAIPNPESFKAARQLVEPELISLVSTDQIAGARIIGSVARGAPNRRSDFDVMVSYRSSGILKWLNQLRQEVKSATNVTLQTIPLQVDDKRGLRWTSYDLMQEDPTNGNIIGVDPITLLLPLKVDPLSLLDGYLSDKLEIFYGDYPSPESRRYYSTLQKILGFPKSFTREMETIHRLRNCYLGKNPEPFDMENVLQSDFLFEALSKVSTRDEEYSRLLEDAVGGRIQYEKFLRETADTSYDQVLTVINGFCEGPYRSNVSSAGNQILSSAA
jgi:predicted nucleotidyltransferase